MNIRAIYPSAFRRTQSRSRRESTLNIPIRIKKNKRSKRLKHTATLESRTNAAITSYLIAGGTTKRIRSRNRQSRIHRCSRSARGRKRTNRSAGNIHSRSRRICNSRTGSHASSICIRNSAIVLLRNVRIIRTGIVSTAANVDNQGSMDRERKKKENEERKFFHGEHTGRWSQTHSWYCLKVIG